MDWDYSPPESERESEAEEGGSTDYAEDSSDGEAPISRDFDIHLPAEHAYLPGNLVPMQGRSILEPGWTGQIICWAYQNVVFPGETIPMMFTDENDSNTLQSIIDTNRLLGLLFISSGGRESFGALCEVIEAGKIGRGEVYGHQLSFKVKVRQRLSRLRFLDSTRPLGQARLCDIRILPDYVLRKPLNHLMFRRSYTKSETKPRDSINESLHKSDAICTPWPRFVYDLFDENRLTEEIKEYFKAFKFDNFPQDTLSFTFWVATNLALSTKDRLQLFAADNALLRLFLEAKFIKEKSRILTCSNCMTEICDKQDIAAMSCEGFINTYCNVAGYVHDVMTVDQVKNVALQGRPSIKFTWFPGYLWTIASCASCGTHIGWRFTASKKSLRPQEFWGVVRQAVTNGQLFSNYTPRVHQI